MNILGKIATTVISSAVSSQLSKGYLLEKVENRHDRILYHDQFPKTTILLPTLNEEWMVEKTLQSITNQNIYQIYPDKFEILIIDSNSEDNTIEISRPYVDTILTMEERNLVKARTLAIEKAKGDIIVFIDADTIYPVNWLNLMLKHYAVNPDVVAVSGQEFHPGLNILVDIYEPLYKSLLSKLGINPSNPMIGHNSSCYKWAFNAIEGFDVPFDYDIKSSIDTQIVLERYFAEKFKNIGTYVYNPQLIVYDYGWKRRYLYKYKDKICNIPNINSSTSIDTNSNTNSNIENNKKNDTKYFCEYWKERENRIRF